MPVCSRPRVFTSPGRMHARDKMATSDLESRSRSCMIELVQELHIRNLCFEIEGCSLSRSGTRVFTSPKPKWPPVTLKEGQGHAWSNLSKVFIRGVYILDLGSLAVAILKLECSQDTKVWPKGTKWLPVTLKVGQGHARLNLSKGFI